MRYILFLFVLISTSGYSQYKSYVIGVKGDTLNIVDQNGKKQGRWVVTVQPLRGEPGYEEQGEYIDDKKDGRWQRYSLMGDLLSMENYRWGGKDGKCLYFNRWGALIREENWRAIDPANPYDTVPVMDVNDPTKVLRYTIVKLEGSSVKHGFWKYYDPDFGSVEKTEEYVMDRLKTDMDDFMAMDGNSNPSDSAARKVTKPKEVLDFEKKNSGKKKVRVRTGSTGGG